jgi:predicted transcriptional regulator
MKELLLANDISNFCHALNSKVRIDMLQYIYSNQETSLTELAEKFSISKAAVTQNIKILCDADLIGVKVGSGKRGQKKICFLKENKYLVTLGRNFDIDNMYETEIPIGQYTRYKIFPTCGIATPEAMIGVADDPRYFDAPSRTEAGILWTQKGYVEYRLPNYLEENEKPIEIQLSMELSSEAPGVSENWPSDIYFYLNDIELAHWTSPGDFGDVRGIYTPEWWFDNWNQYGLLKLLTVNKQGTFIDGLLVSPVTVDSLNLSFQSELRFRLAVPDEAANIGGLTIYGQGFGNYNQGIKFRMIYQKLKEETQTTE